jgi:hypothetical protein
MSGQPRLSLPAGFPDDLFEEVKNRMMPTAGSIATEHLAGSQNGVRYRVRSCGDYSDEFTRLIQQIGDEPNVGERRYQEERSLFGFLFPVIQLLIASVSLCTQRLQLSGRATFQRKIVTLDESAVRKRRGGLRRRFPTTLYRTS